MPIVSVCPYCSRGRVRTSEEMIGTSAKCPACGSEFTVIPTDEPVASSSGVGSSSSGKVPSVFAADDPPAKRSKSRPAPALPEPAPEPTVSDNTPLTNPADDAPDPDDLPDPARLPALVAVAVGVGGMVTWAIPDYGRLVWLGLSLVALVAAGLSFLAADRRKVFAWVALGVAGGSLLVCVALPSLLGEGWWPVRGYNANEAVAVGEDGELHDAKKEIDATKADWMRDGVRVRLLAVRREKVDMKVPATGPGKKPTTAKTKEEVFQVVLEVSNDASPKPVKFDGWGNGSATLTTAAGDKISPKQFEGGATPADAPADARQLTTGLSGTTTLYFEAPRGDSGGRATLELPAAGFGGGGDPVRFYIPLQPYSRPSGGPGGAK